MLKFSHERINPIDLLGQICVDFKPVDWITYSTSVNTDYQYRVIRQSSHDGTFSFSLELLGDIFSHITDRSSFYKPDGWSENIKYLLGDVHILKVYGKVDLPAGRFPGQKERVWVPVKCIK